jgi:hypothetical protein
MGWIRWQYQHDRNNLFKSNGENEQDAAITLNLPVGRPFAGRHHIPHADWPGPSCFSPE